MGFCSGPNQKRATSGHFRNALKKRLGSWADKKREKVEKSLFIHSPGNSRIDQKGLNFRGKRKKLGIPMVVKRLYPHPIPGQPKMAATFVPKGESKHSRKSAQTIHSPFLVSMKNHLRIRVVCFPGVTPLGFQLTTDFSMVINFPIKHQMQGVVLVGHGLVRLGVQIHYG